MKNVRTIWAYEHFKNNPEVFLTIFWLVRCVETYFRIFANAFPSMHAVSNILFAVLNSIFANAHLEKVPKNSSWYILCQTFYTCIISKNIQMLFCFWLASLYLERILLMFLLTFSKPRYRHHLKKIWFLIKCIFFQNSQFFKHWVKIWLS